jgi:predicted TIM-barrel fold metal-dependent hydrolase
MSRIGRVRPASKGLSGSAFQAEYGAEEQNLGGRAKRVIEEVSEVGAKRIAAMDAAGIDMQVLSLTSPGTEQLEAAEAIAVARDANDFVAAAIKEHPKRLAGFAALPTAAPDKAAAELQRCMRDPSFVGTVINGHARGRYLDDRFLWPILEAAEALAAPIYFHPTKTPRPVISPIVTELFAGADTSRPRCMWFVSRSAASSTGFPDCRSSSAIWARAYHSCSNVSTS